MSLSVIPVNTHPVVLTCRNDVRSLVIATIDRKAPSPARRTLLMIRKIDDERVAAGGELDTLPTSLKIMVSDRLPPRSCPGRTMYTEHGTDHDLAITRHNARTGNPYHVWVKVTSYTPGEATTRDDPGCGAEVDAADAWTSMGYEIELTRPELVEVCELWEQCLSDNAADARA